MKKKMSALLLSVVASIGTMCASNTQVGGIWYNFDSSTKTASVTYKGSNVGTMAYSGDIIIPPSVTYAGVTYSVTSIGSRAFYICANLTSVTIPNSVTSIEDMAFQNCESLTSITIPNSVTSIGSSAFKGCTGLTSVIWNAENCADFGYNTAPFNNIRSQITSFTFSNEVEHIPAYLCNGMSNLTSIEIPNSVTSIGDYAFQNCSGLTGELVIPNSVTSIGNKAFFYCSSLTSVTIGNSVTSIGEEAFRECFALEEVTIGAGVTSLGKSVFNRCKNIRKVQWNAINYRQQKPNGDSNCFPFYYSKDNITSFTFGDNVTYIPAYLLKDFSLLDSIAIPASVTEIGSNAFSGCAGFVSIEIPDNVMKIENDAFYNVNNIIYHGDATGAPWGAKSMNGYIDGYLVYSDATKTVLLGCSSAASGEIAIPSSVTSIGNNAFYGCENITSLTIPNSVTSIGNDAFYGLLNITYSGSATGLPWGARFMNCFVEGYLVYNDNSKKILIACSMVAKGEIEIPNSVTDINDNAFRDCRGLTSVTIPNSVTSIGEEAFRSCSGLTSVTIPNSVTNIGGSVFQNCSNLVSVTLPNNITSIEQYAFEDCRSLVSVTIPNSVTSIGKQAFGYCESLEYITIPNSVAIIGDYAFRNCSGLTSVTIPNSVTSFGYGAFYLCSGLTSPVYNAHVFAFMPTSYSGAYTIPAGIESIAGGAFDYCSGLTSVTIEAETPPTLGNNAFYNTNSPIYVPCGTLDVYKTAWSEYASRIKYSPLPYTISTYAENGNVVTTDVNNLTICDPIIMTVTPNTNYHFTQWSDGNTDNPRTIVLTQDTILTAIIVMDTTGTCGKDYALTWTYSPTSKTLTISGNGSFDENMECGLVAKQEMTKLVINEGVTAIGNEAFCNCANLTTMQLPTTLKTIGERAFYNCLDLVAIYNYRVNPCLIETNTFERVNTFDCVLYVLASSIAKYKSDASGWKIFYDIKPIDATTVDNQVTDVTVVPSDNNAIVTWPTSENAETYTLQITKDGEVFCTLIFNGNGQLTGIAFAPGKNGNRHAPAAVMTSNGGLRFTVTGLDSGTNYHLTLDAKNELDEVVVSYDVDFETTGQADIPTGMEETEAEIIPRKILRNGQVFIQRGDKTYTLEGMEVK